MRIPTPETAFRCFAVFVLVFASSAGIMLAQQSPDEPPPTMKVGRYSVVAPVELQRGAFYVLDTTTGRISKSVAK